MESGDYRGTVHLGEKKHPPKNDSYVGTSQIQVLTAGILLGGSFIPSCVYRIEWSIVHQNPTIHNHWYDYIIIYQVYIRSLSVIDKESKTHEDHSIQSLDFPHVNFSFHSDTKFPIEVSPVSQKVETMLFCNKFRGNGDPI